MWIADFFAVMKRMILILAVLLASLAPLLGASRTGLLVPAYFSPHQGDGWTKLIDAAKRGVSVVAVMNPDVGPGMKVDQTYVKAIADLKKAGGRVVGYVFTKQGLRNPVHVLEDITRYHEFYPGLAGIFVDQMPTAETFEKLDNRKPSPHREKFQMLGAKFKKSEGKGSARQTMTEYYYRIWVHSKALKSEWLVVGNPGGHPDEKFFKEKTADLFVTYAGYDGYDTYQTPAWLKRERGKETAHLISDVSEAEDMAKRVAAAKAHGVSWLYVTDDGGGNPWDTLPAYWDEELAQLGAGKGKSSSEPKKKRSFFFRKRK